MKILVTYLLLLVTFMGLVYLSCLIPSSSLKQNVGSSITTFKNEGIYPSFGLPFRQIVLDNFTDSLMINTAYSVDSNNPFKSAMIDMRNDGVTDSSNQILSLEKLYKNEQVVPIYYEKYWHGYLTYLRPLLTFFSYDSIRIFMTVVLNLSLVSLLYLSWKKLNIKYTFALLMGLLATDFFYIGQSLQFSSVFLIALIGSIYLLLTYKKSNSLYNFFFIIGALTSFFDLLTAPIVTLGVISIVAIGLEGKNLKRVIIQQISWCAGYVLLWFSKWAMVQILFVPGAINIAFGEIINRTSNNVDENFSRINAVKLNFFQLIGYSKVSKIIALSLFIVFILFLFKYKKINIKKIIDCAPLFLICIIPYLFYFFAANHSYLHVWYTYRDQLSSVAGIILILIEFVDWTRIKKDVERICNLLPSKRI